MAIEKIIRDRCRRAFLARNRDKEDGLFTIHKGTAYLLYDDHGDLWMTVAVRRQPNHGIVVTDVASGLMVAGTGAKTYDDAIRNVVNQKEPIDKARAMDFYKDAVKLCQEEYDKLRERGVLK